MSFPATVITLWDYIPMVMLCISIAALYLTSWLATYSMAQWPTSRAYRLFLFALAPILVTMLIGAFGSEISNHNTSRKLKAKDEARRLENAVFMYFQLNGDKFPEGNNSEILKALVGSDENSTFLPEQTFLRINSTGEAIDPWGTPYHFSLISEKELKVVSGGPDKVLGTADDLPKN